MINKVKLFWLVVTLFSFAVVGCGSVEKPEQVAEKFLQQTFDGNFENLEAMLAPGSEQEVLAAAHALADEIIGLGDETGPELKLLNSKEMDDRALVRFDCHVESKPMAAYAGINIGMVEKSGKWLVADMKYMPAN